MNGLTERQRLILALVIRDYIETAQPVGSGHLVNKFTLDMSSATVRNEMVALTEKEGRKGDGKGGFMPSWWWPGRWVF